MTKQAVITNDNKVGGHNLRPKSSSRMKRWLVSAAMFAGALLVEPYLNTTGYSNNQVFTVGRPALAEKKEDREEHVTNAKAAILVLERKSNPNMKLGYNHPEMKKLLASMHALGKADGSTLNEQFKSLFKGKTFVKVSEFKASAATFRQLLIETPAQKPPFYEGALAKGRRLITSTPTPVATRRVLPDETKKPEERLIIRATPKPTATSKMPEFKFDQVLVGASLSSYKTLSLKLVEELKGMVEGSKFGAATLSLQKTNGTDPKFTKVNVKKELLSKLDDYEAKFKACDSLKNLGLLYDSFINDYQLISMATNVRKTMKDSMALRKLDEAMMKYVVAYGAHKWDPVDAAYDIADSLKATFNTTEKDSKAASVRGASWFIRNRFNVSLDNYLNKLDKLSSSDVAGKAKLQGAHLADLIKHAEATILYVEKYKVPRMDLAKAVLEKAKSGKSKDPMRMALDLQSAVLGPLVFASAEEFKKDGKAFRDDLTGAELTLIKRHLNSSLALAEKIYDLEFSKDIGATMYPELPSNMVLRALNIASGPESVILENGIFRDLAGFKIIRRAKKGDIDSIDMYEKEALKCIAVSRIVPTSSSKLFRQLGLTAATSMIDPFVAGGTKNYPMHRAGADTSVTDRDQIRGGMLYSELDTMRTDKHMKRVRDFGYNYPKANFWANPILQTITATEGALKISLGDALQNKKLERVNASDLPNLRPAYEKLIKQQNLIYIELINGLRASLKAEFGIDFASLDKKLDPEVTKNPIARLYYKRARAYLSHVNYLTQVMKKNAGKDLTNGTIPELYANPHRTFELLHGVMTSVQDGDKAERDYVPPVKTNEVQMLVQMSDKIYDPGQDIRATVTLQSRTGKSLKETLPGEQFEAAIFDRIEFDPLTKKRIWYALGNDKDRGVGTIAYLGDEETKWVYNKSQKKSEERTFGNVYVFLKKIDGKLTLLEAENYRSLTDSDLEDQGITKLKLAGYEVMKTPDGIEAPVIYRNQIPKKWSYLEDAFWFKWSGDDLLKKKEPWMKNMDFDNKQVQFPILPASPASKNRRVKGVTIFRSL